MYCVECGAFNEDGTRFCTECGSPLDVPEPEETTVLAAGAGKCPHCGAALEPGAQFCVNCGKSVAPQASAVDATVVAPVSVPVEPAPAATPVSATSENADAKSNASSKRWSNISSGPLALVLAAAACVGVLFLADPLGLKNNAATSDMAVSAPVEAEAVSDEDAATTEDELAKAKAEADVAWAEADAAKAEADAAREEAARAQEEADAAKAQAAESQAQADAASAAEASPDRASSFPRTWSGTYDGHNGGEVLHRPITFRFSDVDSNGSLYGSVEIYVAEDNSTSSYNVSGSVDWNSGYLYIAGTGWINMGDLDVMRNYEGYVDFSTWTVSGTTWNQEGENYENWSASA